MGKTQYPLNILVAPSLVNKLPVDEWRAKGHIVVTDHHDDLYGEWHAYDLILHPRAWRMTPDHLAYLEAAITQAQREVYPPEKRRKNGKS